MAHEFIETQFPEIRSVLGVPLVDLTLGHYLILELLESPFIQERDAPVTEPDVVALLLVCSRPSDAALDQLSNLSKRGPRKRLMKLVRKCAGQMGEEAASLPLPTRDAAFTIVVKQLHEYLQWNLGMPEYTVKEEQTSGRSGAPFWKSMMVELQNHLGLTERDILDRPIRRSLEDIAVSWETRGLVKLKNREDDAFAEESAMFERFADEERAKLDHITPASVQEINRKAMDRLNQWKERN